MAAVVMGWLQRIAAVHGGSDRVAVIDDARSVTGRELMGKSVAAADFLGTLNTPDGQPVPALLTTNADALALLFGGAATNKPLAPLGPKLTAPELADAVRGTGSPVLLTEPQFAATAAEVAGVVGVKVQTLHTWPVSATALTAAESGPVAFILHTAGSTGMPKPVPFTSDVLTARADVLRALLGLGADARYATGSPLHHIGGLGNVLVALDGGAAVLSTATFSFDWWRGLRQRGATHCLLVPTMIEMLLSRALLDAVPLTTLIYGASPITPATLHRVIHLLPGVALINLFGQTEGSPITCLSADDHRRAAAGDVGLLTSVGRAVPELRLTIREPDESGTGEVLAAAAHLAVHAADGWLHTGDLGAIDPGGYLHLRGRLHDMVVRGGENVHPQQVESVLTTHPGVAAAGVVGVPDARLGETLAAFIVAADPANTPNHKELYAFTRERLAGFKVPAYWYDVDALPLNSAGKLIRSSLLRWHLGHESGGTYCGSS